MKKLLLSAAMVMMAGSMMAQNAEKAKALFAQVDEELKTSVLKKATNPSEAYASNMAIIANVEEAIKITDSYPNDVKQIADKAEQKIVKALKKDRVKYVSAALQCRQELLGGAITLLQNNQEHATALDYLKVYINSSKNATFADKNLEATDTMLATAGYCGLFALGKIENVENKDDLTLMLADYARRDKQNEEMALSNIANAYRAKGDTVKWLDVLAEGAHKYPKQDWFVRQLCDYYLTSGKQEEGMKVVDNLIAADGSNFVGYYLKGVFLFNLQKYEDAEGAFAKAIELNPNEVGTYRDAGQSCLNYVQEYLDNNTRLDFKDPKAKKWMDKAEGYFLKMKELAPGEPDRWAIFLYRIYYNLYGENDARTQEMQKLSGM